MLVYYMQPNPDLLKRHGFATVWYSNTTILQPNFMREKIDVMTKTHCANLKKDIDPHMENVIHN